MAVSPRPGVYYTKRPEEVEGSKARMDQGERKEAKRKAWMLESHILNCHVYTTFENYFCLPF